MQVAFREFRFIERSGTPADATRVACPPCCATWSGARSMGPVNVRLAKQQGVTPNEKILGCCGEVKCCMRYEHDTYKEFKQRAPFRNSTVKIGDRKVRSSTTPWSRTPSSSSSAPARGSRTSLSAPWPGQPRHHARRHRRVGVAGTPPGKDS